MNDTEDMILALIFQRPHTLSRMQAKGLASIAFSVPKNRYLFDALTLSSRTNEMTGTLQVDEVWAALCTEGKTEWGNPARMFSALAAPDPIEESVVWSVEGLMDSVKRNALNKALSLALDTSRSGGDICAVTALLERALSDSRGSTMPPPQSLKDGMLELAQAQMCEAPQIPIKTGLSHVDTVLKELSGGELIVVGARPGTGKTSLVTQLLVESARHGIPSLFYTGEMLLPAIHRRMLSQQARITFDETLKPDRIEDRHIRERAYQVMQDLQKLPVHSHPFHGRDIDQLCADAKRFVRIHGAKIICFDYLQLIPGTKETQKLGRYAEVSAISTALKQLATDTETVVIALAQFNRSSEQRTDKKPTMSDFRDSGKIEQDMDMGWLMSRPDPLQSTILFQLAKNRNGKTGEFNLDFCGKNFLFERSWDVEPTAEPFRPRQNSRFGGDYL